MIRYSCNISVWLSGLVYFCLKSIFKMKCCGFLTLLLFQMSLTIQQIILDAKRLAGRLKERETEADALLTETQTAYRHIHTMKQVDNCNVIWPHILLHSHLFHLGILGWEEQAHTTSEYAITFVYSSNVLVFIVYVSWPCGLLPITVV